MKIKYEMDLDLCHADPEYDETIARVIRDEWIGEVRRQVKRSIKDSAELQTKIIRMIKKHGEALLDELAAMKEQQDADV